MECARRQAAAESQILLVMAVDHIDPPVRKQVRRIVVPGMQMTITNRRPVFGTIDIRRQLIGNLLFEGPAHGSCGVGLERPVVTGAMRQCPWRDEGR